MFTEFLLKKYRPKDRIAIAEQKGKLMQLTLGKGEGLTDYEMAVIKLGVSYNGEFADDDKISIALIALGLEHGETMYNTIKRIETKGELSTFSDLMEAVKDKWRATGSGLDSMPDSHAETSLIATGRFARPANNML